MRRAHAMPFGAQLTRAGVQFRLWAPSAASVELLLDDPAGARSAPMRPVAQGWYEVLDTHAGAGSRYRFRIDHAIEVADPASRFNPDDAGGASMVIDPARFDWGAQQWRGRPWHEAVIYELHVGTFTAAGTFRAAIERLDHLAELGITLLELMPVGDFPGRYNWGYDGVLPFAPDASYGEPEDLKALIRAAHERRLGVLLDVVYNHFGPQANYLARYAPQFFTAEHATPWGAAMNFGAAEYPQVRSFFIHNALYWLEEYAFDGLRLDAVHAIHDASTTHILTDIARAVHAGPGRERHIHLIAENSANEAAHLGYPAQQDRFDAQWNDDVHHCLHVLLTRETAGYYADFAAEPAAQLARGLAEGFVFQGEHSHFAAAARGSPSAHLPVTAFVNFLQNHDQIGNRPLGDRLAAGEVPAPALQAAVAILLLAPAIPMLFMGEEWGAREPFAYFCDFEAELTRKIRAGRAAEFADFARLQGGHGSTLPDPASEETFAAAKLYWSQLEDPRAATWFDFYKRLLKLRRAEIVPRIPHIRGSHYDPGSEQQATRVSWQLEDGSELRLLCNFSAQALASAGPMSGRVLYASHPEWPAGGLAPMGVAWLLIAARKRSASGGSRP